MTALEPGPEVEPFDIRLAQHAPDVLAPFNRAGVLAAADVHVARRLAVLARETDVQLLIAVAFAVRAPRLSHVCADLSTLASSATSDFETVGDLASLPWPDTTSWLDRLRSSALVAVGDDAPADRPLRLVGTRLYLDRYWQQERAIAADVSERIAYAPPDVDGEVLADGLRRMFNGATGVAVDPATPPDPTGAGVDEREPDLQQIACAAAVLRRFAVIAGGPGTGKTTTVARLLALLDEQAVAAHQRPPSVALAAPTGKAAARLEEAVHAEAHQLSVRAATRARLLGLGASTLHRLLGWRPDSHSRFRHDRGNRLPYDVVIVDETSMVSLSLMAKLIEAVRPDARLVLLGDPDQLASVEAGAVLGDIVGPSASGLRMTVTAQQRLTEVVGGPIPAMAVEGRRSIGDGIVVLRRVHRFRGAIAELASAVQRGDSDTALEVLAAGRDGVQWVNRDAAESGIAAALESVRDPIVAAGRRVTEAARAGEAAAALESLHAVRVLCAHRRGPYGVDTWMAQVERWLRSAIDGYGDGGRWYVGRPLLVTSNDYGLGLYNGDTGVMVAEEGDRVRAVFERRGELLRVSPTRLDSVDTVHAMTIHKSQGSQFDTVAVMLPDERSPILTRELLYTAITRAQEHLIVVGPEASIRTAIIRPVARASGLGERLWADEGSAR